MGVIMSGYTGNVGSERIAPLLENIGKVAQEVKEGKWANRQDALGDKIQEIVKNQGALLAGDISDSRTKEAFIASVNLLETSLGNLSSRTDKLSTAISSLASLGNRQRATDSSARSLLDTVKQLTAGNAQEIKQSLEFFKGGLARDDPESIKALASWMAYHQISIDHLSLQDRDKLLPELTFLDTRKDLTEQELGAILNKCVKLNTLHVQSDALKTLPPIPNSVASLTIKGENLEEINQIPREYFDCSDNPHLKRVVGQCPPTLEEFHCQDCPELTAIPSLNEKLKHFDCSNCLSIFLPNQLSAGLETFNSRGCAFSTMPVLPRNLRELDCSRNPNLQYLSNLPPSLQKLDCSQCENLTEIEGPIPPNVKIDANFTKLAKTK